jgi:hypothetical protein
MHSDQPAIIATATATEGTAASSTTAAVTGTADSNSSTAEQSDSPIKDDWDCSSEDDCVYDASASVQVL